MQYRPGESDFVLRRFSTGMVNATDLPFGWGHRASSIPELPGAVGRSVSYLGADAGSSFVNVRQRVFIFPTDRNSAAGYDQVVSQSIPEQYADRWILPPELDIETQADQLTVRCLAGSANGLPIQTCVAIGQYGDMLSELSGNIFDDRWLTMDQFRRVLERVDARMYQASQMQLSEP